MRAVRAVVVALVLLGSSLVVGTATAQAGPGQGVRASAGTDPGAPTPGLAYLRARSTPATGRIAPRPVESDRVSAASARFSVTYTGFPAQAKAAFQRAVDLWSVLVDSDQTIRIEATWTSLAPGVLGGAGALDYIRDFPGAPRTGTWYPVALANALSGQDLSPRADIEAVFASNRTDWYFGTDANPPPGKMDLTTVVLHEIGHGLGMVDSIDVSGATASWGAGTSTPFVFDRIAQTSGGTPLANVTNGSTTLAQAVTSGALRWGGAAATAANGGTKPFLYAPAPYEPGSSVAHLDEARYPTGTANALMTPYLDDGEALHDPGDVALGMFRDQGWRTAAGPGVPGVPTVTTAVAGNGQVFLGWTPPIDTGRQRLTGFQIARFVGEATTPAETYTVAGNVIGVAVTRLTNGTPYRFSVSAVNASGAGAPSARSATVTPADLGPFSRADTFVRQQLLDLLARNGTTAEQLTWLDALHRGTRTPSTTITGIAALGDAAGPSHRMTRLYSAYFLRLPDFGGYTFWTGRLRSGSSLKKVSDTFAASSEFQNRYGALSNRSFVTLVYRNVLGRAPDAGGLSYWVGRLDRKVVSRGQLMLNFSESSENLRKMESEVGAVQLRAAMLRRMPTAAEYQADVVLLDGPATLADLAADLLASSEYDARIP